MLIPLQDIPPASFAALGQNATFRRNSTADLFNPTNSTPPFFQILHPDFQNILGANAFIRKIAMNTTFASGSFAFEAPIFNPTTNELFFASVVLPPESSMTHNNRVSKINMTVVERALANKVADINVPFTTLSLPETVQITNGGTGPFRGSLLLTTRGRANLPSALVLVNPKAPNNATVLLDNFFGRQFNSMNDLKIHPSGNIFFTDDNLGFTDGERPPPLLPSQTYIFDPRSGLVKVVADGVQVPNGIAFSPDGTVAYIADSASLSDQTRPSTVYAFDVNPESFAFNNRRVFSYIDSGIPDGMQVDTQGNLYVATGDGVQIFRKDGVLLGKLFFGTRVANMAFTGDGKLVVLVSSAIFVAQIDAKSALSVPPSSFSVLGQNATFRQIFTDFFNPTNSTPPFFQIFHTDFQAILGPNTFVRRIAMNTTFASGSFAFEAPIFNPPTNELFFASVVQPPESSMTHNNRISKIDMTAVEKALASKMADINVPFTTVGLGRSRTCHNTERVFQLSLPETVQITNGGTGPFRGSLLLATRGRASLPSALVLVNPKAPNNATVLLDNFFGRQFNSMNDLKIHPSGNIFFTDDNFGFTNDQKPPPLLPSQSYMFDPRTGLVRMVADGELTPNGIAFNSDGSVAYIGDSSALTNQTLPTTVYSYDVDPETFAFNNRRVFAFIDTGIPDGIQVDTKGNVYVATGDGVQVFRKDGVLLGKVFLGTNVANMAFAGDGRLVILAGSAIFLAQIEAKSALVTI
ncbi:hypothetical protein CVT25_013456 [Psilocybe cyanescens]|uniref:SMP-30/Gluconolactonase/LRE-like region domain-containing protein n=1 Tax=Psilocybe cyanescens TaxID=93625 RepID=A0A409WTQ7_PSICY|nr:hypothetical protein CVT25_013456 [Psilocybe cyanescens]